jgi:hypothetical protein
MRVHFGLADATSVDGIEIHWPSGKIEQLKVGSVDRIFTVEEGKGVIGEFCNGCAQGKQTSDAKKQTGRLTFVEIVAGGILQSASAQSPFHPESSARLLPF